MHPKGLPAVKFQGGIDFKKMKMGTDLHRTISPVHDRQLSRFLSFVTNNLFFSQVILSWNQAILPPSMPLTDGLMDGD